MVEQSSLETALKQLENYYQQKLALQAHYLKEQAQHKSRLEEVIVQSDRLQQVRILFQESAAFAREQARQQIEYMVTQALQYVFGQEMEFKVVIEELRGRPEGEFLVVSTYGGDIVVETKPQDARGGGVVDVISLALRLALLQANTPYIDGPIILDEPGKHVSEEYSMQLANFLKHVSQTFHRQVILVTHDRQLAEAGDKVFLVELKSGVSHLAESSRN